MTPGARIQAAIELLEQVWDGISPPNVLADRYFRKRRYAGSGDRRAINQRLYDVLRRRARLDWWIERTGLDLQPGGRTRVVADLAVAERTAPDEIAAMFSSVRHCPGALSPQEAELADALYGRPLRHRDMPRPVAFEYPDWMDASFAALWGEDTEREIAALNEQAPVDLRVNTLKATPEQAQKALADAFIDTEATPISPLGLRVNGHPRLGGTEAFKRGLVEIQDEGSQLLALLVGARPGMAVVDFCAGAGGKTLALAAAMGEGGRVNGRLFACDISANRMERMQARLKRAGAHDVRRRTISAKDDNWVAENASRADRVLADVPCTGTGTWRRDVNAKWRFQPTDLDQLRQTQLHVLRDAASLVKPGGRLIYATCSLLQEENELQIAEFLKNQADFSPLLINEVWAETIGGASPPTGPGLRLSPASTGTDGFFCAVLEREK